MKFEKEYLWRGYFFEGKVLSHSLWVSVGGNDSRNLAKLRNNSEKKKLRNGGGWWKEKHNPSFKQEKVRQSCYKYQEEE